MTAINRREFNAKTLAALGAAMLAPRAAMTLAAETTKQPLLPTVRWGKYDITRVLTGHNPIKGTSHFTAELNKEMKEYFPARDPLHGVELLRRSQEMGINTCQVGSPQLEDILRAHYAEGGKMQWIPTFYSEPKDAKAELDRILKMDPKPIGAQHFGNTTDMLASKGKLDSVQETLKRFRDAGLLVGFGSHKHELIDYAENKGWDVDFYQCCFYRVKTSLKPAGVKPEVSSLGEIFEEEARQAMIKVIKQVSKPCIAFKVFAGNRHTSTPEALEGALRFAFENIKPNDVVLLGMWQKYKDQVAENVGYARKILTA